MIKSYPIVIIGGGPAGYTAAIYAARAGLKPRLYQGPQPGGQLMTTTDVENYPGYPKGILGPDMMEDFKAQAERFGTQIHTGMVTAVDFSTPAHFQLTIDQEETIYATAVIIATGSSAKWLGIPSEKKFSGKGVSSCAVCDGFFFKKQDVAIVGGGDTAAEEALYLSNICNKVHMLIRRDQMRASVIMQERVKERANIEIHWHTETDEILGEETVDAVRIVNNVTKKKTRLPISGFFVAIGHQPNTQIFSPYLKTNSVGYILTQPDSTATSVPGIFAAGDVQDPVYRQAVTAAATGCMAALDAKRFIDAATTAALRS